MMETDLRLLAIIKKRQMKFFRHAIRKEGLENNMEILAMAGKKLKEKEI